MEANHSQFAKKISLSHFHSPFHSQFPQFEWVDHRAQEHEPDQFQEQMKGPQMMIVK